MPLSEAQLSQLAETMLTALLQQGGATLAADRRRVLECIKATLRQSEAEERDLDREARRLLEAHLAQAPVGVDQQKLLALIKRKLADERGIPL